MSDKQKALLALTLASQTSSAALASLSSGTHLPPPALQILQKDLSSLLTLLHSTITKCALTLNPSSPSYSAALPPLNDLSAHTSALTHCALLFDQGVHGATLTREVVSAVRDVIEAVYALVQTFLSLHTHPGSGTGKAGEEYMVRTGGVHDLIDKAQGAKGISKDNLGAVRKKWGEDRGTLDDAFREVGEMVVEGEEDGDGDGEEDGWDELGLGSGTAAKMDKNELERTKQIHTLLRLTTLLHKRILLDLLSLSPHSQIQNPALDILPIHSTSLLTATDDLISTLYTPQDPTSIRTELTSFVDIVRALQSGLVAAGFFPTDSLENQLGEMSVRDSDAGAGTKGKKKTGKDIKKWFDTCFEQIYKLATAFAATLAVVDDGNITLDAS